MALRTSATTKNATPTSGVVSQPSSTETAMTAPPANTNRTASVSDRIGRRMVNSTLRRVQCQVMRENFCFEYRFFAESGSVYVGSGVLRPLDTDCEPTAAERSEAGGVAASFVAPRIVVARSTPAR